MCGIFGYIGEGNATERVLAGLSALEYRGYDSAGLAAASEEEIRRVRRVGRVAALREAVEERGEYYAAPAAIGHTRWATHGGVSEANAHPHTVGGVTLVHNGIIENEGEWRAKLTEGGIHLSSQTDTEVAAALLSLAYEEKKEPLSAIRDTMPKLTGSFAFGILFQGRPCEIWAVRKDSPLLVGYDGQGAYLSSDITALLPYTRQFFIPEEGEAVCLTAAGVQLFSADGQAKEIAWQTAEAEPFEAATGGYSTFMEKEMHEQPAAICAALLAVEERVRAGLSLLSAPPTRLHIVACGSAMHAGLLGARFFADNAALPAEVFIASEYRYHMPPSDAGCGVLLISQSGETADTLAALRETKRRGQRTLAIVNAPASSIAREADEVLYTRAGPEIAVATTKGYTTQLAVLLALSFHLGAARGLISEKELAARLASLRRGAPAAVREVLARQGEISGLAARLSGASALFYIGRGQDADLAAEGSLKLKEISYLHSEAYAAGELKHGTISLIEEGTPVLCVATDAALAKKSASNLRETVARGAYPLLLCSAACRPAFPEGWDAFCFEGESEAGALFGAVTAMQLLAYEVALGRGCDIDRPRNLAKSVTVE